MSSGGSRASSAASERLPPVRPSSGTQDSPRSEEDGLNKFNPLPPITTESEDQTLADAPLATSETIVSTMAGETTSSGKGRRPKITRGFRRETGENESLSSLEDTSERETSGKEIKKKEPGVTMETQTEWSWLEDMQLMEKIKAGTISRQSTHSGHSQKGSPRDEVTSLSSDSEDGEGEKQDKMASKEGSKTRGLKNDEKVIDWNELLAVTFADKHEDTKGAESVVDEELKGIPKASGLHGDRHLESEMTFASESSIPYPSRDDEYGIPILALSSESEESDDEEDLLYPKESEDVTLPSIGPPEIIKYRKESKKKPCNQSMEQGQQTNKYQKESEKNQLPLYGADDRLLTKEDLETARQIGGELEGGMFEGTCEFCQQPIKPFPTLDEQKYHPPEELYCCNDYQEFVLYMVRHPIEQEHHADKKIDIRPHPPYGSKQARRDAKEKALQRMREREMARQQQAMTVAGGGGGGATFYQFARQMKTINYQLSSQKCLEEGWTLKPSSPIDKGLGDPEVFEPEPMPPPWADSEDKKARTAGLIRKWYPDGSIFVILFSDGTGTVYYPSGRVAISITSIEQGLYTYIVQDDTDNDSVSAVFEPSGVASSHYSNGALRLFMNPVGGVELDAHGTRRRKWSWKDWAKSHVHAPPLQPITCAVTPQVGLRIMSQESMTLTFTCRQRSVRFQVGAKLKLLKDLPPSSAFEEDELFREEISTRVQSLFDKVANLMKFPNSPKLHKLPTPTHLSSKVQRLKKIREEQQQHNKKLNGVITVN